MANESEDLPTEEEPDVIVERQSFLFHHVSSDDGDGNRLVDHYTVGEKIGVGRGVQSCQHKRTGHKRALKVLAKADVTPQSFHQEIKALRAVDHPNLLRLFESFEDDRYYYIVTELSTKGDLFSYLSEDCGASYRNLEEADMARLLRQVLVCINHMHGLSIIHSDIKPENLLLEKGDTSFQRLTLADFGFAQFYEPETRMNRCCGTPAFWSPEVFRKSYGPKADIWAVGVLGFVLLTGQEPFVGKSAHPVENAKEIYRQVKQRRDHFDLDVWSFRSEEAKSFVQSLLNLEETERPTALEALQHPWFEVMLGHQSDTKSIPLQSSNAPKTSPALQNLIEFSAQQKLKQATYAYLVAHRTYKSRRKVIDEIFRKVDVNSDGLISQSEIEASFREKGELLTKEEITDIFERVDIDKNGSINYWEFVAAATKASTLLCNENLKIAFEVFDKNNSGAISAEEIRGLFYNNQQQIQDGDEVDESVIDAIIQQVDENGDGEICFEEFSKMMQENLLTNKRPHDSASTESESVNQRPRQCPSLTLEKG